MAFSFTTEPTVRGQSVRSPLIYAVTETTANDDYKYILDVFIHDASSVPTGTADYRLVCSPNGSNVGKFDVSKIAKSLISPNYGLNTGTLTSIKNAETSCRHITCKGGYIDDSGTINAEEATSSAVGNLYTQGYLDWDEAQNTGWYVVGSYQTDMPTSGINIPTSAIYYFPIVRNIVSAASFTTDDGTTGSISVGASSTLASERLRYIPIGTRQLSLPSDVKWYDVTFTHSGGTKTYRFNVTCEPKYDYYTVMYLNKYGAWDYVYFFKKSVESLSTTKDSYKRIDPSERYEPQTRVYNKEGTEKLRLNTGYVSEDMNEAYKQMMLSEHIQIVEKNGVTLEYPAWVTEQELTYQTGVNDQLINYTFTFEYAYDAINNIW